MNAQKSIAFVAALLITTAGMYGIVRITDTAANMNAQATQATTDIIPTLPTLHVHPTAEQLHELRGGQANAAPTHAPMPYYSFANDNAGA